MNLADALSGRAGLKGIRWMFTGAPREMLRRELGALLPTLKMLGPCRLLQARFRPGRRLVALYQVRVRTEGAKHGVRHIAVIWTLAGGESRVCTTADFAAMQAEAALHGVLAPFRELVADVQAWGMRLEVSPLDLRFPQLIRLSDPRYVREMLARAYAASEMAPEPLPHAGYVVWSVRYWPGKRHVLSYGPRDGAKGGRVFAKLSSGDKATRASRATKGAADWLTEHVDGVSAVRPLAYLPEDTVVLYPRVFGTPLSDLLRSIPRPELAQCLQRAGVALHTLHRLPEVAAGPLAFHDFGMEVEEVTKESAHLPVLLPSQGAAVQAILERAQELHERLPQEPPTFTHGDFKSEHLWVASSGLTLIDFDTCRFADPALDVGKLLADLQLRFLTDGQTGLEQAQEQFLAGYARGGSRQRLVRSRLYQAIELVKLTARRVALFDHDWASRSEQLIGQAQAVINHAQGKLGLPIKRHFLVSAPDARRESGPHRLAIGGPN